MNVLVIESDESKRKKILDLLNDITDIEVIFYNSKEHHMGTLIHDIESMNLGVYPASTYIDRIIESKPKTLTINDFIVKIKASTKEKKAKKPHPNPQTRKFKKGVER